METLFRKRVITFFFSGIILVVIPVALVRWADRSHKLLALNSGRFMIMGTFAQIQIRCYNEQRAHQAQQVALQALQHVDQLMSTYRPDSELTRVNQMAAAEPVSVELETYSLLSRALEFSRMTKGAFDVTVEPLLELWRKAAQTGKMPTAQQIEHARNQVGYEKLRLSDMTSRQVSFTKAQVKLNVDAVAKGYAVDYALQAVRRTGVEAALVEVGGEIACFGENQPGQKWLVGIQDPFAEDNEDPLSRRPRWLINLSEAAVATSGNYRRFFNIGAKKMSHIIDPRTGQSVDSIPSVTVIAPTTLQADALATAVSVMGVEKGMALIESLAQVEAFLIAGDKENPRIYRSSGFHKYEINYSPPDYSAKPLKHQQ